MPAVIKASPSVLAGNIALVGFEFVDSLDLSASINATFVTVGSSTIDASFRPGSPPPAILAQNAGYLSLIASKRVLNQATLASCSVTIANGLKTIEATYTTEVESPGVVSGQDQQTRDVTSEITTQSEQRSIRGTYVRPGGTIVRSFAIDYLVRTVTFDQAFAATANLSDGGASFAATIGLQGNDFGVIYLRLSPSDSSKFVEEIPIETIRTYRNNLGQARISVTRSAQLVAIT